MNPRYIVNLNGKQVGEWTNIEATEKHCEALQLEHGRYANVGFQMIVEE